MSKGLETGCAVCQQHENLSRCGACKVVSYCGKEHQVQARATHKWFCNEVKRAQATLDNEDAKLRNIQGDVLTPDNPLENPRAIGHFWGIWETRPYMRARYALIEAQLKFNTRNAVEAATEHVMDLFRLCRSDNMGVRDLAPSLLLRLGRDQEAYDFCKWWATCDPDGKYDWGDLSLPYLSVKDADVFEPVDPFVGEFRSLSHGIAVTLIKIRLLVDLQALERAREEAGPHVPQEILDSILQEAANSPIVKENRKILERDQKLYIEELKKQVKQMYDGVNKLNKYFWAAILHPTEKDLTARPNYTSFGNRQEMQVQLRHWYNAWAETPGAVGVIEELSKGRI
ncbi:hypothetical protein M011DRAFT_402188 [Sporormia fimetaria CBS 119925]|uniref:MYND-type domain-containing protein n=1 Tax=Sporormia fimetaria CBS 119925 TaxID=1340428 RepID=A0A6A6V9Z0_9PLEO|nr:hypothetical protein M011DRAFT_402188 [Sporormia fimetaria CBS 119925]